MSLNTNCWVISLKSVNNKIIFTHGEIVSIIWYIYMWYIIICIVKVQREITIFLNSIENKNPYVYNVDKKYMDDIQILYELI